MAMSDVEIIRALDQLEADLRSLEHRIFGVRAALRERVDPLKRRKDLGYWPEEDTESVGLRLKV